LRLARKNLPLLPMVVMSGFTTQETMVISAEAGASIFLPKPITPEELREAVRRATGSSLAKGG
jgi:DNA-binding NtrC family response regulator